MLGTTDLQNWYAQANSLQIKPKVVAEWNANAFSQPYIYGHGTGSFTSLTTMTKSDGSQSNLVITDGSKGTGTKLFTITFPYLSLTTTSAVEYVMNHTVATASTDKAFKLSFFAQAVGGSIRATIIATAKDASNNIVEQTSKTINIIESKQLSHIVESFTYSGTAAIKTIEYRISVLNNSVDPSIQIKIDSPRVYESLQREMVYKEILGVAEIFKPNRPGDPYMSNSPTAPIANGNVCPHYISYQENDLIDRSKSSRTILASKDALFKYYVYDIDSTNNTATMFARYQNPFITNKIVLKVSTVKNIPSSVSISTFDVNGTESSPTTISTPFDSNGLAVIYYNSGWSKNAWSAPSYENNAVQSNFYTQISGIKITFTSTTSSKTQVHLVEVSPRLELDLSSYVKTFSINNELSNDNLPLPISISNSNTATIEFENLPNQTTYQQPFDNYAGLLKGIISKNVNMKIYIDPFGQDSSRSETQIAYMKTSSWESNDLETSTAVLYDKLKDISAIPVPSFYQKSANPMDVVSSILDLIGYTDYDYTELETIKKQISATIPYFWTVATKGSRSLEAIQNVLLPYQISMYVDAYGIIRFKHVSSILNSSASSTYAVTDSQYGAILPNITEFNIIEENAPSKASVDYSIIGPSDYTSAYNNLKAQANTSVFNIPDGILGYIRLAQPLKKEDRKLSYVYNPDNIMDSTVGQLSGYLLIGSEIIKYNGMETTVTVRDSSNNTQVFKHIVNDIAELDELRSFYTLKYGTSVADVFATNNGRRTLCNLERGCFGTPIEDHDIFVDINDFTSNLGVVASASVIKMQKLPTNSDFFVTHNSVCNENHRIYSATFEFPKELDVPKNGEIFEFGLSLGTTSANKNTNKGATRVAVQISETRKSDNGVISLNLGLEIKQFNNSGVQDFKKTYVLGRFDAVGGSQKVSPSIKSTYDTNIFINRAEANSIVVMLNPLDTENNESVVDHISVIINGDVVNFTDGTEISVSNSPNADKDFKSIKIPALKLKNPVSVNNTYMSAYTNGKATLFLNSLQAFEMEKYNKSDKNYSYLNNLTTLSSVMHGNLVGLSNKNEVESVVRGYKVAETAKWIGFSPDTVGREIREFNIEYLAFPVLYSYLIRGSYSTQRVFKVDGKDFEYVIYTPGESITFSSIDHTPTTAKFAMINSYTEAVYINAKDVSGNPTTNIYGSVLTERSVKTISETINEDNTESEISLKSKWVQSEQSAINILSSIIRGAVMKRGAIEATVFGNPLIEVGDVLEVKYSLKNFVASKYAVVSVKQEFDNGLTTRLVLRRVSV